MRTLSTRVGLNGPLGGNKKEASSVAPSLISLASALTNLPPIYSRRLATLVAQPVTITFPLVSRISSATVSVYPFASQLTTITRVSLCVDVQAPAELKMKASDTAL